MIASTKHLVLAAALIVLTPARSASVTPQKNSDLRIVGKCFVIHGRLSIYNGSPSFRIWRIGTHRMLGVEGEDTEFPGDLARVYRQKKALTTMVYGDYEVCPTTKSRTGHMQMVIIKSARNLVVLHDTPPRWAED